MLRLALIFLTLPLAAQAEEWVRLSGPEIAAALTARVLGYADGSQQDFKAEGQTLYDNGTPSIGRWRIEEDRYCSQWPPSATWVCYAVEREARGLDLRFIGSGGTVETGRYIDLQ